MGYISRPEICPSLVLAQTHVQRLAYICLIPVELYVRGQHVSSWKYAFRL